MKCNTFWLLAVQVASMAGLTACAEPGSGAARPSAGESELVSSSITGAAPDLTIGGAAFDATTSPELEVKRTSTGHLLVRPVINGVRAGWFIFDTGAGICVVSTPHAAAFALRESGSINAVGVGGVTSQSLWRADSVTLGPLTLQDHPIMSTDLSFLKQYLGEEICGVVGYGVLSHCITELDIATPRIAIHNPESFVAGKDEWHELDLVDRIPAVRARFEGREGLFRLDTGANGHVTFHEPAVRKWDLLKGRDLRSAKSGGVGGFVKSRSGSIKWFELGGVRRENVPAIFAIEAKGAFADTRKDGNIGAELLRPFVLVLDYPNQRIAYLPHDRAPAASAR